VELSCIVLSKQLLSGIMQISELIPGTIINRYNWSLFDQYRKINYDGSIYLLLTSDSLNALPQTAFDLKKPIFTFLSNRENHNN